MSRIVTLPPNEPMVTDCEKVAGWWRDADDGRRLVCDLCPRACSLKPGDRGFCFVRENRDGRMISTTYGRSTGFCIDPIEKKPLHHFYPGTSVLSFGTAGCNLGCMFCQNWTTSKSRDVDAASEQAAPEAIAEAARQHGCRSVAFTYNDPIVWAEYAIDTARACHERGVQTVAVTSGYISPTARTAFYEHIDAANVDLKGFSEDFYRKLTGGHLEPVLDTLRWLAREGRTWLEITNLVIPKANDAPDEIERMCRWIVGELGPDVPLHFSAFHPDFKMTDQGPTPRETLVMAHDIARQAGLRYVYTGNIADRQHQATYCPGCKQAVIERDGYLVGEYQIRANRCVKCGAPIAGRFDNTVGDWGGRRMPIRIPPVETNSLPLPTNLRSVPGEGRGEGDSREGANIASGGSCRIIPKEEQSATAESAGADNGPPPTSHSPHPTSHTPLAASPHPNPLPEGEGTAAASPRPSPLPKGDGTGAIIPRPVLTDDQEKTLFAAAGRRVAATVQSQRPQETMRAALGDIADTPVYGAFVSLKRSGTLRSCCGFLGQSVPLWEAVDHAAVRAAKDDPRFPPVSPSELAYLDMEVWLLWGFQPMAARGPARAEAIVIGTHGLQIARGAARGLLLPSVAVDHHLDAKAFLQQVCVKAGLPLDAWLRDDTALMTFEGFAIHGRLSSVGLEKQASPPGGPTQGELAALLDFCRGNLAALLRGATPSFYLPRGFDGGVHGLALTVGAAGSDGRIECSKITLHPDMPLQTTLYVLVQAAAQLLQSRRTPADALQAMPMGLNVLTDPAPHGTAAQPQLEGIDTSARALLVTGDSASAWVYDPQRTAQELLDVALRAAEFSVAGGKLPPELPRIQVSSLAIATTEQRVTIAQVSRPAPAPDVRPPAVAGGFYPGKPEEIRRTLDELFAAAPSSARETWPAALVPHAGWVYSGRLAAAVLNRLQIPEQVIVLCPKHRPGGADWAVAPHRRWSFPGGEIDSDLELARRLAEAIAGLELDAIAHRQEHAIEVQLPLLARLAPRSRVVGITIGGGNLADLRRFAQQMAGVLREMPQRPLLLVSSDMNHFADDAETRRVDRLALDAIESLDAGQLFETVERHRISMCGMRPAVIVMETLRELDSLHRCQLVGYTTSAEASGDKQRVVGYAGVLLG